MSVFLAWVTPSFVLMRSDGMEIDLASRSVLATNVPKFVPLGEDLVLASTGASKEQRIIRSTARFTLRLFRRLSFNVVADSIAASARKVSRDDRLHGVGLALIGRRDGRMQTCTFSSGEQFKPHHHLLPCLVSLGEPPEHPEFIRVTDPLIPKLNRATLAEAETIMDEMLRLAYEHGHGVVGGDSFRHTLRCDSFA